MPLLHPEFPVVLSLLTKCSLADYGPRAIRAIDSWLSLHFLTSRLRTHIYCLSIWWWLLSSHGCLWDGINLYPLGFRVTLFMTLTSFLWTFYATLIKFSFDRLSSVYSPLKQMAILISPVVCKSPCAQSSPVPFPSVRQTFSLLGFQTHHQVFSGTVK